jgi:hypothetical protein
MDTKKQQKSPTSTPGQGQKTPQQPKKNIPNTDKTNPSKKSNW